MKYELNPLYSHLTPDKLVTIMGKDRFTLDSNPFTIEVPASKSGPKRKITVPVATQDQLKKLHEIGHTGKYGPLVIANDKKSTPISNS